MSRAGGRETKRTDKHGALNAKAPRPGHVSKLDPARVALIECKKRMMRALDQHGVDLILALIERGPSEDNEIQHRNFWAAVNFAADRGGMPRVQAVDVEGMEIPPIEIRLVGYARPTDS